jgi:hypothetical protein
VTDSEHTTTKLARALEAIPGVPEDMIEKARTGHYHDYLSPLDFPEMQLVADLRNLAGRRTMPPASRRMLLNLAKDVINGKHDASKAESDEWMRSPDGQETMALLTGQAPGDAPGEAGPGIWIKSTRGPDDEPACEVTWGPLQWYAPVADVRETAIDLVTCAAYAEMMLTLIVRAGIPPEIVQQLTTDLLSGTGRRMFGTPATMELMPAGGSSRRTKRRHALVLLKRGSLDAALSPDEARAMALAWLQVAEGTESDQLVSEALRGTGVPGDVQDRLFGYLRHLRANREAAST